MTLLRIAALGLILICAGCMVGPNYHRAAAIVQANYKELRGWIVATPQEAATRGPWWSIYHDPLLDSLERQVVVNNQTIKQFVAQYDAAVALTHEAQAGLFPTLGLNGGVTRSAISRGGGPFTQYTLEGSADWTPDLWGRIRRQVESQAAGAQVSAADLADAALSAEATLATDYFDLRAADALTALLQQTVIAYRGALQITENQYNAGTVSRADVVTAQAQLQTVVAQLAGTGVQRAQFEHAIAVLTGRPPAALTIPAGVLAAAVPVIPPGLPSTLLERRPDIAAAERTMKEENALIGVAVAAYYPDISLSTLGGFAGNPIGQLFTVSDRVWSLGAAASETLFQGGLRPAAVQVARANYDAAVASYRQTVLTAFQQVEDELAALRILEQQAAAEATAIASAQEAVAVTLNEYKAGTVAYTSVITQQELLLSDQQAALSIQQSRLLASVALVQALGGGWSTARLPPTTAVTHFNPLRP